MKLNEKIKQLRKEKKLSRTDLLKKIENSFGEKSLSYRTLERIEHGDTDGRASSLEQICKGLEISFKELIEGTEKENPRVQFIRHYNKKGKYVHNDKAYSEILSNMQNRFLSLKVVLEPKAKTKPEKDPSTDELTYRKWIYALKGKFNIFLDGQKNLLRKGDVLIFESSIEHYFENPYSAQAQCLIIQDPKHI